MLQSATTGNGDEQLQRLQQTVDEILAELPDNWSAALNLKVSAGLGYDEIASVLGATRDQVRIWIYRARKQIHRELGKHDLFKEP